MKRSELKEWAKNKIKGRVWELFVPLLVAGILTSFSIVKKTEMVDGRLQVSSVSFGIFFSFVEVGIASFMVKFINDQEHSFSDLFAYFKDYVRIFLVTLLEAVYIVLYCLLLVIPGLMKAVGYTMVPLLLADEKYKDLGYRAILKKSEEMMNGHKWDLFVLALSYFGWYLLGILTLGILFIWITPYQATATYKFLYDIKTSYESNTVA